MGTSRAFTLTELMVALAIIAILIALLLPVISQVRRKADSIGCLSNLRAAGQAMMVYVTENNGWLPGSPSTSGRHLWKLDSAGHYVSAGITPQSTPLPVVELFDYIGPLASSTNLAIDPALDGRQRLTLYRTLPAFQCPANRDVTARCAGGFAVPDGPMLSYATATAFLLMPANIPTTGNTTFAGRVTMPTGGSNTDPAHFNFWSSPPGYKPKFDLIGEPSQKVFLADAARRTGHNTLPNFIYNVESDYVDTLFSDFGPFYGITRSYSRYAVNFPKVTSAADARIHAYRHGTRSPRQESGAYRLNVLFFDGHAATLTDIESARPDYWLPSGSVIYRNTRLNATDTVFWADVWQTYLEGATLTNPHRVP